MPGHPVDAPGNRSRTRARAKGCQAVDDCRDRRSDGVRSGQYLHIQFPRESGSCGKSTTYRHLPDSNVQRSAASSLIVMKAHATTRPQRFSKPLRSGPLVSSAETRVATAELPGFYTGLINRHRIGNLLTILITSHIQVIIQLQTQPEFVADMPKNCANRNAVSAEIRRRPCNLH